MLTVFRKSIKYTWCGVLGLGAAQACGAAPAPREKSAQTQDVGPNRTALRPSLDEWRRDASHGAALVRALAKQGCVNIRVEASGHALNLTLGHRRVADLGLVVGRAARAALAAAPRGITTIRVTYTERDQAVATYEFFDMAKLRDYFAGKIDRRAFFEAVLVRQANRDDVIHDGKTSRLAGADVAVALGEEGEIVRFNSAEPEKGNFQIAPRGALFYKDPDGATRYHLSLEASYDKRLREGLYFDGALGVTALQNVSDAGPGRVGGLPHVSSDMAEYRRGGKLNINRLLLNEYLNPAERWYARLSGGIYDEMFCGVGGQALYLPQGSRWAADLSVDALRQRGFQGWLSTRDYQTVTAVGALHYRLPYDLTMTVRAGRFLAKDEGARVEIKRRFRSGVEVGAWYSHTHGDDGAGASYHDRGVYLSMPLDGLLAGGARGTGGLALAPWGSDVAQLPASPGDLYEMMEKSHRDMISYDGLGNFAERPDEQNLAAVNRPQELPGNPWPAMRARLNQSSEALPTPSDWLMQVGLAAGAVWVASLSDKKIDQFVKERPGSRRLRALDRFGKALPYALVGAAGAAFALGDERMQNTGLIALESAAAATGAAFGAKYMIGRAGPQEERGNWAQVGAGQSRASASLPSTYTAAAFAVVTPFAREYDAPWLYGVATVGAMGQVAGRRHWFSDTVAGGLVGYATATWLWKAQRGDRKAALSVIPGPKEISVTWQQTY